MPQYPPPDTSRVYPNVEIGEGAQIGDFVTIGVPPRGTAAGELKTVIGRDAVIRSHTVIYAGNVIGDGFQTGHATLVREENEIGDNVSIGTHSVVEHHVKIADGVRIHSQAFVPEFSVLEQECWIGPGAVLTNARYPRSAGVKERLKGPRIGRRAKIGANCTLLPGITIGENALVGAGAVVTGDVAAGIVVAGNPARPLKNTTDIEAYRTIRDEGK